MKSIFIFIIMLCSLPLFAQNKEQKIEYILSLSNTIEQYTSYINQYKLSILEDRNTNEIQKIKKQYTPEKIKNIIIKSFSDTYTDDEINSIYSFYQSEAGKSFMNKYVKFSERLEENFIEIDQLIQSIIDSNAKEDGAKSTESSKLKPVFFDGENGFYEVIGYKDVSDLTTMKLAKIPSIKQTSFTNIKKDYDLLGRLVIDIQLDQEGTKIFKKLTENNIGRPIAIVFNNNIISAPVVNDVISEGKIQISGSFTTEEADAFLKLKNR